MNMHIHVYDLHLWSHTMYKYNACPAFLSSDGRRSSVHTPWLSQSISGRGSWASSRIPCLHPPVEIWGFSSPSLTIQSHAPSWIRQTWNPPIVIAHNQMDRCGVCLSLLRKRTDEISHQSPTNNQSAELVLISNIEIINSEKYIIWIR